MNQHTSPTKQRSPGKIAIIMGSKSDWEVMTAAKDICVSFEVPYHVEVISAHRSPKRAAEFATTAKEAGYCAIIAGAGFSAHLAGVMAAHTTLPVVGVPIASSPMSGFDSLLSTVQMPGGIPVACMGIGRSGAKNAALFTIASLAVSDPALSARLAAYRQDMEKRIASTTLE